LARGAGFCTALPRCGDSSTERQFPSDKVYLRDDRGIVGVESLSPQGLGFFVVHTVLDARPGCPVPGLVVMAEIDEQLPAQTCAADQIAARRAQRRRKVGGGAA
jgi:hypothetical protein